MYGIREDTVSKSIKKLEKYGFIKCNYNWQSETKSKRMVYLTNHNSNYNNNKNNSNNNLSNLSKKDSYDKYMVYDDEIYLDEGLEELENLLAPFKDENE